MLPLIPRFTIWCGTRRTADWHRRFRAAAVVYGHLHPKLRLLDGVRFHEVSLGYPRQWRYRPESAPACARSCPVPIDPPPPAEPRAFSTQPDRPTARKRRFRQDYGCGVLRWASPNLAEDSAIGGSSRPLIQEIWC